MTVESMFTTRAKEGILLHDIQGGGKIKTFKEVNPVAPCHVQGDQKVSLHLMITVQKVTSNVPPPVPRHLVTRRTVFSKTVFAIARTTLRMCSVMAIFKSSIVWELFEYTDFCIVIIRCTETFWSPCSYIRFNIPVPFLNDRKNSLNFFSRFFVWRFASRTGYLFVQNPVFETSKVQTQNTIIVGRRRKRTQKLKKKTQTGRLKKKTILRGFCSAQEKCAALR
jgi:hypothetical protein